ncbi:MAG TPA: DUF547 domain-containing protein [Chloroflexi bacterium]|nr:DUF547 domain-containing protein [Chloroflexota bacterium]
MLVGARERTLNLALGVRPGEILNPAISEPALQESQDIAAELKQAITAFKASAFDGHQGNDTILRQSAAYITYRTTCSPQLRELDLTTLTTREERLAFWINLYNALVIDAVIALGVQHSVTEGRAGVLTFFRRAAYIVGGQRFSCEDVEHGILRANRGHPILPGPQFGPSDPRRASVIAPVDPRIHFALNCASRSCPPIGVYSAGQIDAQLDLATANFLAADVAVDPASGSMHLSSIFRWYAGDFGGRAGLIAFLLRHLRDDEHRAWLLKHRESARFVYRPYDWSLNVWGSSQYNDRRMAANKRTDTEVRPKHERP